MSSALNSVFGSGGILGAAMSVASIAFPPLGLATSLSSMLAQGVGQAVSAAAQQLTQQCGMPKFVGDIVKDVVSDVLKHICPQTDPHCDQAAHDHFGGGIGDLIKQLTQQIFDGAKAIMDEGGDDKCKSSGKPGKGGKSAGSWLEAIATAMGKAAGDKAAKLVEFSNKLSDIAGRNHDDLKGDDLTKAQQQDARDQSEANAQFQTASQEFNMLQSTFSNAIKSIGEGITTMARKG